MVECSYEQPSLIEYARFHGLAESHTVQDIRKCFLTKLLPHVEDTEIPQFTMIQVERFPPEPKFRLNSKTASLLASCLRPPPAPAQAWPSTLSDYHRLKNLKLEHPVLKTDHASDMNKVRTRKISKTMVLDLPPIEVAEKASGNLVWSPGIPILASNWNKKVTGEKLQTTLQVFKALQETLSPVYAPQMYEAILNEELALTKRSKLQPIPPPLLASQPDQEPQTLSPPRLCLQTLPNPRDPNHERMHKYEEFLYQDRIRPEDTMVGPAGQNEWFLRIAEHGPVDDQISAIEEDEKRLTSRRQHVGLYDVNLPELEQLTVPESDREADARSENSASLLENIVPEPMQEETVKNDIIAHLARNASHPVEGDQGEESLEPTASIMALEVPILDNVKPAAPGTTFASPDILRTAIVEHLKHTIRSFDEATEQEAEGAVSTIDLYKPLIDDSIQPPPQFNEWISQPAFAIRSEDLLWRLEVLRVLTFDEETYEDERNVDSSLRDQEVDGISLARKRPALQDASESFYNRQPRQLTASQPELGTSHFGSLAGFMHARKAYKRPRLDPVATTVKATERLGASAVHADESMCDVQVPATPTETTPIDFSALSTPQTQKITSSRTIIVSSRLLKSHRQLTQNLETRPDPPLVIIYRDFEINNNPDATPDIIITPTIAAILTSLQATTQRSLPGQGSTRSQVFDRMHHLSRAYEKLFVLITLPAMDSSPLQSPATCAQISTLYALCASFSQQDSLVQPIIIPSPPSIKPILPLAAGSKFTDPPLYQWTHAMICKHALDPTSAPNLNLNLLAEETLWELFLCKAGLNPFAAQVVLGRLKKPQETAVPQKQEKEKTDCWGLRAFVQMGRGERLRMFADVVGRDQIERVSDVLDAPWGTARRGCQRSMVEGIIPRTMSSMTKKS